MPFEKSKKKKKRPINDANSTDSSLVYVFLCSLKGALLALGISVALAFVMCMIAYASVDPDSLILVLSLASLYISAFFAGFIAMKLCKNSTLMCGLISGGMFMLLYMFFSFFFSPDMSAKYSFIISFLLHALIILFSILGSLAGQKRKAKSHKPRR